MRPGNQSSPTPRPERDVLVPRGRLTLWLVAALVGLAGVGLAMDLAYIISPGPTTATLADTFSLSAEVSVPNWYASCLLFACAVALWATADRAAQTRAPHRRRWLLLALVFAYMSLDEAIEIHEGLGGLIGTGGVLYFDWVIPASAAVIALAIAFWPMVRDLRPQLRLRVIVSGALYVGGALLMELPLGWWTERAGDENLTYVLLDFVEETLELCGASLFLASLWHELQQPADTEES